MAQVLRQMQITETTWVTSRRVVGFRSTVRGRCSDHAVSSPGVSTCSGLVVVSWFMLASDR